MTLDELKALGGEKIQELAAALVTHESVIFKYLRNTGHSNADIRRAVKEYHLQQIQTRVHLSPGLLAAQKMLAKVVGPLAKSAVPAFDNAVWAPVIDIAKKQLTDFNKQFGLIGRQALDYQNNVIQEALQKIPTLESEMSRFKAELAQPLFGMADQYSKMAQMVSNQLKPQLEFFQKWTEQNQKVFGSIRKSWSEIEKKNRIDETNVAKILRKYKWFINPSMPYAAIKVILDVAKKSGRKDADINKLFIDYFSRNDWENLQSMVADWKCNPMFKARMPVLENCVRVMQASSQVKCNGAMVVLPTLISQIDGLLTDYLETNGIPFQTMYDDFKKNGTVKRRGRKSTFRANASEALTKELHELAMDMFLNILFQHSQRGKPLETPFNFNRHKIMHGESVRFGRKDYVIRAFMVLDFLAHLK